MLNFVVAILKYFDLSYINYMDVLKEKSAVLLDFFSKWGSGGACKKRVIHVIYHRNFFWIFRKILGWEREINTAPKPSPEVAPS